MPVLRPVASVIVVLAIALVARGEKVTLDKPVPVTQKKADKSKIAGRIIAYDEEGFEVRVKADAEPETVQWSELDTKTRYAIRKTLLNPKDGDAHVELGREMLGLEGGREWADKAFAVALRLDPKLKDTIAEVKKDAAENTPAKVETARADAGTAAPESGAAASADASNTPRTVGSVKRNYWGPQSEEAQAEAVRILKAFGEETRKQLGMALPLHETKYFLFYSDLPPAEAKKWADLLDVMYARLCELVGIKKGENIWRGKGLVFVFQKKVDYRKFQVTMHETDPSWSAGMCHNFGDGMVHIAFYREEDERRFAQVLVHESAHGFLHRYRSPVHIPSWVNEGLAEWVANRLVYEGRQAKAVQHQARQALKRFGTIGEFFDTQRIEPWQYPVAEMVTTFMIETNRKGYVDFVNAIKDGMNWEEALEAKYEWTRERLLREFGAAMGV